MDNNRKYQILLWIFVGFAALACGVGAYEYVSSTGADKFIAIIALVGVAAIAVALYALFRTALEELFGWIQNRFFANRFNKPEENKESSCAEAVDTTEKVSAIEEEIATILKVMDEKDSNVSDEIEATANNSEIVEQPRQVIEPDMIFIRGSYEKLQNLEKRLMADKYLTEDLEWIQAYNGRKNLKPLIIFISGLMEERYFMPNRDPKIKIFFEERYRVSLGQNFERSRREKYVGQHRITFYNYPF